MAVYDLRASFHEELSKELELGQEDFVNPYTVLESYDEGISIRMDCRSSDAPSR